jgi:hypothetical protein
MKGKPWPADDEKRLKDWYLSGTTDLRVLAFNLDGLYTEEAIRQKLIKFGLMREEQQLCFSNCCSTQLSGKKDLPTIEDTLKDLSAAIDALNVGANVRRRNQNRLLPKHTTAAECSLTNRKSLLWQNIRLLLRKQDCERLQNRVRWKVLNCLCKHS